MVTLKKINIKYFLYSAFSHWFCRIFISFNTLPLGTAERKPSQELSDLIRNDAISKASSIKDSKGHSFLHWGDRRILISREIFFQGNFHLMLIISCIRLKSL